MKQSSLALSECCVKIIKTENIDNISALSPEVQSVQKINCTTYTYANVRPLTYKH